MSLKAVGNKILVEQYPVDDTSRGGVFIPEQFRPETWWCKVISIGGKVKPGLVAVGETIYIKAHHGMILERDGRTFRLVEEADVIGTLAPSAETQPR